jgi:4-amino-4-deoxy-L-arabinose transferase-like glycosyltransferase
MTSPQSSDTQYLQGRIGFTILKRAYSISPVQLFLLIMSLAVILRLGSALYQGNTVTDLPGVYDQISYDGLARRVVDGFGFSFAEGHWPATRAGEPTAHWSYLYTLYLAAIYKVFGPTPLIARIIQALIAGIFQTLLIWRIGTRLFNRTVGLVAAALSAVYIYFFYYAGALITETFYITCILWTFDASFRIMSSEAETTKWTHWLELGFAISLTVLLRQVFLLFLPFLYLWMWWNLHEKEEDRWKQILRWSAVKGLATATLVLVLMIVPFTIRNQRAFGTFVLLNTNAGFAFFWGNHPVHGTEFMPLLSGGAEQYYDLIPDELLPLNEAELDKALLDRGIQFIADDPGRFLVLSVSRAGEYFKFWPSADSGLVSNISRVGSFGISLPFMLYGLWIALAQTWKSRTVEERWNIVLLLLFILIYTAVHLFSWTLIRYRLPVDAVLLVFAAYGIYKFVNKTSSIEEN